MKYEITPFTAKPIEKGAECPMPNVKRAEGHYDLFLYHNLNPKGIHTRDCVIRAFAFFFGVTWREAFLDLINWCADRGRVDFNYRSAYYDYLKEKGYPKHKAPEKGMTVEDFRDRYAKEGKTYIIQGKRHLTIISDQTIYDIGDCSLMVMDNYWER